MSPRLLLAALGAVLVLHAGCSDDPDPCEGDGCGVAPPVCGNNIKEGTEQCDDGNTTDGDGCQANCTPTVALGCGDGRVEGLEVCDDGNTVGGDACAADCSYTVSRCAAAAEPALPGGATCAVTRAGNGARLFTGVVLKDGETLLGGQVLVDAQGIIQCAACDCASAAGAAEATQVSCPTGVISPGLINPHDHISFTDKPYVATQEHSVERFEHRQDWRRGLSGHTRVDNNGSKTNADLVGYQELRQVMAGTTTVAGAGGAPGLLRNVDDRTVARQEGLEEGYADSDTFPLGDSGGEALASGCSYPALPSSSSLPKISAYLPHIAEGIDERALNEFRCLSAGNSDVLFARTAIIHGIGLTAKEMASMAARGTGLVWSPRSNVTLYGDTAMVTAYKRMGVSIALGTDWLQSGSMNLLRELQCADYLNTTHYAGSLSDSHLWRMVTANASDLTDVFEKVGRIAPGKVGDLAIFRLRTFANSPHRAVITANPEDVVLTVRGGKTLYGDGTLVDALKGENACDTLDVCGAAKAVCLQSEIGKNLAALQAANSSAYPLFACGTPENEPTCVPRRTSTDERFLASRNNSTVYTSEVRPDDKDGDGIVDSADNCPAIFNPVRPVDNGVQVDSDGDRQGDACDVCPLEAGTACVSANPADDDGDGVATWRDNCPFLANANQADGDADGKGDVCDGCPEQAGGTCANADPSDPDRDGVMSPADNCPYLVNVDQTDTDADGQGDACDPCAVANPNGAACPATIHDLKTPVAGAIPLLNTKVAVSNVIVTALNASASGYFIQASPPPQGKGVEYSGIYVFAPKTDLALGDRLDITQATLMLYRGVLELTDVTYTKVSSGNPLPEPVVVRSEEVRTGGPRAEALDAVLLELRDVSITTAPNSFDEFFVDENPNGDGTTTGVKVDDQAFDYVNAAQTVGTRFTNLKGVLTFTFNEYKLLPRNARDMRLPLPPLPALTGFSGGAYIRVGSASGDTFPQVLTVTMESAFPEDVTVAITSSDSTALGAVGGGVVIPAGQTSATVKLNPVAQAASVTLTATLGSSSLQAAVRVLGQDEQPAVTGLDPATVTMVPGGTVTLTVALDRPAPANTTLALSVDPADLGTFANATAPVAADALQATFTFTASAEATGTAGTVTATLGESSASTAVTLDQDAPRLVSVVANEAGPVNAGATREFTLTVDRPAPADATVTLAALPGTGVTRYGSVPATATLAMGQTQATFIFTADAAGGGAGKVSASLYGITREADLTVTPPPPKLATLSPATATVLAAKTFTFTVTLDRPAQTDETDVALRLEPATDVGSVPATVRVARAATTATFTFTAAALEAPAQAVLTASFGGVDQTSQVTVNVPAGAGLVINEVDYDMPGAGDSLEFVELYNSSSRTVSLTNLFLVLVNGSSTTAPPVSYQKIALSEVTGGALAPGEYLVVGSANVVGPLAGRAGVKTLQKGTTDYVQNGASDGVGIYDATEDALIDSLAYEGNVAQASITGSTKKFDFREGTADTTPLADSGTAAGSLSRNAGSADTNVNAVDFVFTTTSTPGAVNVITVPTPAP
ncbi:lamin tail domain-containing protein [Pyxidicoccus trucidator]|uniref:lamin tail domain-containing protein n=1 Tax=Pyxidicoccus trucidator TaxID=2709662 RepID=UPI001F07E059|nr:lamin tail domain-containing protein [Pyxidicoccus trucidator]